MRWRKPKVFLIAKTHVDPIEARKWLDHVGATEYKLEMDVTDGEQLVQLAGKRCYMSFQPGLNPNVKRVRTDMRDFIDNILKVGHGSVIEHAVYSFAIEDVSRVFTGEMNRHRAGVAISEGSMRFIRFTDIPMVEVPSLENQELWIKRLMLGTSKVAGTRKVFEDTVYHIEQGYRRLLDIWHDVLEAPPGSQEFAQKKFITSMMRRIIPMGAATGGVWTMNLRSLRHVFTMRCSPHAEEEILYVASMMLEKMLSTEPLFFRDFAKVDGYWQPKYYKV